jgi:Big-like domain-containing protein
MKLQSSAIRNSLFVLTLILTLPAFRAAAQSKPDAAAAPAARAKPDAAQAPEKQSKSQPGLKPVPRDADGRELVEEGPDFLRLRQDWFFKPRAFPLGFIPQGARERALQQKKQMYQREGRLNLSTAPGGGGFVTPPTGTGSTWFSIGPQATASPLAFAPFTSGRVTALVVNPNNPSNVYLGGADGGLWVTTDGGTTWTALAQTENPPNTGIPTIAVGSLAVDPTTCGASVCTTVYVGTGEDNFGGENIYGEGVLKCIVAATTPPTATCTQDSTFHLAAGAPLDNLRGGPMIGALAVNPKSGSTGILLAGVRGRGTVIQSGIYCSADAGVTWKPVFGISGIVGTDVAFASDGTAFVALGFPFGDPNGNNGIFKSSLAITSCTAVTDAANTTPGGAGSKWIKQILPAGTPSASLGRISLAIFPSPASTGANATVYAAIADSNTTSSNLLGLIKTTNGGATWTQLIGDTRLTTSGICNAQCFYDMPLAVSPASASDVFFGGGASHGTLIRSTDGGATWTEISRRDVNGATDDIHVDMHAIALSANGGTMYVGNDGGVWKTTTPTLAGTPPAGFWANLNQNLGITQFYPGVSIHPSNPGFSMGGTQDNDVQVYQGSNGSPLVWNSAEIGCDGGFTAIDFSIPSTSFGECEYIPNNPPFPIILTTFNGDGILGNGFLANSGIDPTDRGSFIPPLVMDPNTSTTLYFGTCRVWASIDGANSWNPISPDVTAPTHLAGCAVGGGNVLSTIAVAPGNSNTIYVGSDTGASASDIEVTSNGGTSWSSIATAILPTRAVTQVAVDPSTPSTAYVTFSGFGSCNNSAVVCDGKGHVFKTINSAAGPATLWVDISGTATKLPDIPVNALVIDPNDATHNTLYVGTDIGGFFTTDGGANWSPLGAASSLPNAQILSLTLHNASRTLRAATHGRGVWDLLLGGAGAFSIASISPFSANAGAASITNFTVTGSGFTASSVVKFAVNGTTTSLTTSCLTPTSCTATIPAAQLLSGGTASVTVANTSPVGTTNAVSFTILNPIPVIASISPTTTATATTNFSLTVNGASLICGGANATVVLFNGSPRSNITACSATSLTVALPNSDLTTAGTFPIDLFTPQPGGGPNTNLGAVTLTITQASNPVPTITTLSPASKTAGGPAFTLTVNGTNFVGASTVNFAGAVRTTTFVSATQLTASILAADIATAGTPAVTVTNPTPGGGTSNSVNFAVTTTGSFTVGGTAVTATAGASGTSTITVTPTGGFTGNVNVTCPAAGLPAGVTCTPNPLAINVTTAAAVTGQLTLNVVAPSTTLTASAEPLERKRYAASTIPPAVGKGWWALSAGTGLAALFLLFLPGRKRYRVAMGLGLVCVLSFSLGCSHGSGGGGPVATTTKITVNTSKLASSDLTGFKFTITVTASVAVNGQVQLFDGASTLGAPVTVSNGTASISSAGLLPGTHSISAHYLGDSATQASSSLALNVTSTGTTTFAITATPAASNGSPTVNITIN